MSVVVRHDRHSTFRSPRHRRILVVFNLANVLERGSKIKDIPDTSGLFAYGKFFHSKLYYTFNSLSRTSPIRSSVCTIVSCAFDFRFYRPGALQPRTTAILFTPFTGAPAGVGARNRFFPSKIAGTLERKIRNWQHRDARTDTTPRVRSCRSSAII